MDLKIQETGRVANQRKKGFTLLEIMIAVAIIALLAAISIPNLLRARHNANEVSALASIKAIIAAQQMFYDANIPHRYGTFAELTNATPPYLNSSFKSQSYYLNKQGYYFLIYVSSGDRIVFCAGPNAFGITGSKGFQCTTFSYDDRSAFVLYSSPNNSDNWQSVQ